MDKQERFKAILMANMKDVTKKSALESIIFLIGLHDITLEELNEVLVSNTK